MSQPSMESALNGCMSDEIPSRQQVISVALVYSGIRHVFDNALNCER